VRADAPTGALVLDLWKTLVPLPVEVKRAAFLAAARALGEDPEVLAPIWRATRTERETGPMDGYLLKLRETLGRPWTDRMLATVAADRLRIHGAMFGDPLPGALALLTRAEASGRPTAVVSNGSSDVRAMFENSALAGPVVALVLSAEVGMMKPAPGIFRLAAATLSVPTDACIYVGDGNDYEMEGAAAVGMAAILLDLGDGHPWAGQRITNLDEPLLEVGPV
jgi:putative hydrolase of the HAD superfamily